MSEISRRGLCHNLKRVLYHKAPVDRLEKICKRRFANVDRVCFICHEAYSCCICANKEASCGSYKITYKSVYAVKHGGRDGRAKHTSFWIATLWSKQWYVLWCSGLGVGWKFEEEEELRKKELEVCKKELMCDRDKAIRRCEDKQYRMERQLQ